MYQKAVYFYCCVVNVSVVKFTDLILWYMNLMNNGQMNRGNENLTQYLPWWLRKTTKKKNPVRLVGTGMWTRDLPNASLVRYHGATSLGHFMSYFCCENAERRQKMNHPARWLRGNARDSHSGGPWFKSRCRPTWLGFFRGFPQSWRQEILVGFLNHEGKCWVGFSLPRSIWPLFIKFIYHKIKSVKLTTETLTTQQ